MNLAVLFGGKSGEHEVSLVSAASVARNIDATKHKIIPIGIAKDGRWFLQDEAELERVKTSNRPFKITEDKNRIVNIIPGEGKNSFVVNNRSLEVDAVFPVVHGTFCEDGILQGLLESANVPYIGCNVAASALTMDKEKTKIIWQASGLPIVPYVCMRRADLNDSREYDAIVERATNNLGFPLFVKPCNAGSSVGAAKASNAKELYVAIGEAFLWDNKILIEKAIDAREIECSVTGNSQIQNAGNKFSPLVAYVPGEILPTHDFYDYDAKYNDPNGADLKIPALLDEAVLEKIREMAKKAYSVLDCSGMSRVDFFIDRKSGEIYLNEINTIPGFTSISMFPKMCEAQGLQYADLIELLIDEAVEIFESKAELLTSV